MRLLLVILGLVAFLLAALLAGSVFDTTSDFFNYQVMVALGLFCWLLSGIVPESFRREA